MRNDLKAAIDYFNEKIDGFDEFLGLRLGDNYKHFVQRVVENKAIHQTALSALRDAQARQEGCERCINGMERFLNTAWWSFCPWCGRALEPVGNADMLATVSKTESVGQGPEPGGEGGE